MMETWPPLASSKARRFLSPSQRVGGPPGTLGWTCTDFTTPQERGTMTRIQTTASLMALMGKRRMGVGSGVEFQNMVLGIDRTDEEIGHEADDKETCH